MKTVTKYLMALMVITAISFSGCRDIKKEEAKDEHGHEHNEDGTHMNEEKVEQEEFQVETDSIEVKEETHTHDNGEAHHDH